MHYYPEIRLLISDFCPRILALQKINLKETDILSPTSFSVFHADFTSGERPFGSTAVLATHNLFHEHVELNTELRAIAFRVSLPVRVAMARTRALYLPP